MPIDDEHDDDDATHHTWRPAHGPVVRIVAWAILLVIALSIVVMFVAIVIKMF